MNGLVNFNNDNSKNKIISKLVQEEEQAHFVWIALTSWCLFNKNKTITYENLRKLMGILRKQSALAEALGYSLTVLFI
jgi:hypothetical protein